MLGKLKKPSQNRSNYEREVFIWRTLFISSTLLLIGALFNHIVILNNSGKMPVYTELPIYTNFHFSFTNFSHINYPYLSDIIPLPGIIFSIGDLFLFAGMFVSFFILYHSVRNYCRARRRPSQALA